VTSDCCCCCAGLLLQAVSTASADLSSALTGVLLDEQEKQMLKQKLNAAADKKLADLLQVWSHCHTTAQPLQLFASVFLQPALLCEAVARLCQPVSVGAGVLTCQSPCNTCLVLTPGAASNLL